MKLVFRLAYHQLKKNRLRTLRSLSGIVVATMALTAVLSLYLNIGAVLYAVAQDISHVDFLVGLYQISEVTNVAFVAAFASTFIFTVMVLFAAFYIGANRRVQQFSVLKNVGGAKHQVRYAAIAEVVILAVPGLLIGVALGWSFAKSAIRLIGALLQSLAQATGISIIGEPLLFEELALSVLVSCIAIFLSAWLAIRQATAQSESYAFSRSTTDSFTMRHNSNLERIISKVFAVEGILAYRSLMRNRLKASLSVTALAISAVLMIGVTSIGSQAENLIAVAAADLNDISSNVAVGFYTPAGTGNPTTVSPHIAEGVMSALHQHPHASILGIGRSPYSYSVEVRHDMFTEVGLERNPALFAEGDTATIPVNLIAVDRAQYARLAQLAGVSEGANILLNRCRLKVDDLDNGFWYEFSAFAFEPTTLSLTRYGPNGSSQELDLCLQGELLKCDLPAQIGLFISILNTFVSDFEGTHMTILLPEIDSGFVTYFAEVEDEEGFVDLALDVIQSDKDLYAIGVVPTVAKLDHVPDMLRNAERVFVLAIYGLIGMFIFLCVVTTVSTTSANVRTYARDIAIANSVGMDSKSLNKVLGLGNLFCSLAAICLGVPFGIAASMFLHDFMPDNLSASYTLPWLAIVKSIIVILVIVWTSTYFSVKGLDKNSPVEAIRSPH